MKKKKLSVTGSEAKSSKLKSTGKVRNPIAANPLLGKAACHKTANSRKSASRAQTRQSMKKVARGSDDWQNSNSIYGTDLHYVACYASPVVAKVYSYPPRLQPQPPVIGSH